MNIITAYIVREILKGSAIAMLFLLTLINVFTFKDELKHLGEGDYGLQQIVLYITLISPTTFYELMPSAALLGSLFVLSTMENNRELVAMRVSGISLFGLIRSILIAGGILVGVAVGVGEFIAPDAEEAAKLSRTKAKLRHEKLVWQSLYGLWLRDGTMFINVRQIKGNGILAHVNIYELDEQDRLRRITHAGKATYIGNEHWLLSDVHSTEIGEERLKSYQLSEYQWHSSIEPDLLKIAVVTPNKLSLYDLAVYIQFLKKNHQKSRVFELSFWGRIVNPFVTLVMLLVATPFVMGFKRAYSTGPRLMIGILIGLGFNVLDKIVGNMGLVYGLNPVLVAVLPSAVVLCGALYAIHRLR